MSPRARSILAYVALYLAVGASFPYMPLYYRDLGLSLGEVGAILALTPVVALVASPSWGALSDRQQGSPLVLLAATMTGLAGAAILAVAHDRLVVIGGAAVLGAGMAGVGPILDARALEAAGTDRASYGPVRAWGSASYIAGALGTGYLIDATGIRSFFPAFGAALVVTALVGLSLRPPTARTGFGAYARPIRDAGRLFGPRGLGAFLAGTFLSFLGMAAVLSFTGLRFQELGAGATIVGLAGAIAAGVEVPIMLRFPSLASRFGPERVLIAGAAFVAARSIVAAVATTPEVLLAASIFGGIGFALFFVGGVTYVSARVPAELAATAQGIFQGVGNSLAQVFAAASGGAIAALVGIQGLFVAGAACGVLATTIIVFAVRGRREPPSAPPSATFAPTP